MKRSAHFKPVLDDSWITVDTTSLHQHKLHYCTIAHIAKVNSTSCVILRLAHYVADVIPLLVYVNIFPSNPTLR